MENPILVRLSDDGHTVRVFLPIFPKDHESGYFLVKAKTRLPRESLEFRMSMSRWFRGPDLERVRKEERNPYRSGRGSWKPLLADMDRFREIARLVPETRDGVSGVFLEMSVADALRTYVVYDFLPEGGLMVRDGGFWFTYDLPSYVEAAVAAERRCRGIRDTVTEFAPAFRIGDVFIRGADNGGKFLRIQVVRLMDATPTRFGLGIRIRLWEVTREGEIMPSRSVVSAEWEPSPGDWVRGGVRYLDAEWAGPVKGAGSAYYGLTIDAVYESWIQHTWASSSDLFVNVRAFDRVNDRESLRYPGYPDGAFAFARSTITKVAAEKADPLPVADIVRLRKAAATMVNLQRFYPNWKSWEVAANRKLAERLLSK